MKKRGSEREKGKGDTKEKMEKNQSKPDESGFCLSRAFGLWWAKAETKCVNAMLLAKAETEKKGMRDDRDKD